MTKIPRSIRALHSNIEPIYIKLKDKVDDLIKSRLLPDWHYISRIKNLESYAQKLETGRIYSTDELEDFFACTIVVRNYGEILQARKIITDYFTIKEERPNDNITKRSDSFPFDDLRIYSKWIDDPTLPGTVFNGRIFEIQIKTFLQHAWTIATHDLIYKSDQANWAKERIAYQIKAMLEHAEISISEATGLAANEQLICRDPKIYKIKKISDDIKKYWSQTDLPKDTKRLAENLNNLFDCLNLDWQDFIKKLDELRIEKSWPASNISIYSNFIQAIIFINPTELKKYLEGAINARKKSHILLIPELDLPRDWDKSHLGKALLINV